LLEKAFVAKVMRDAKYGQALTDHFRTNAWFWLERAAETDNVDAIRLMIRLLHGGRTRARDDKQAYFWLLRLRRLGDSNDAAEGAIESALTEDERDRARRDEEQNWRSRTTFAP